VAYARNWKPGQSQWDASIIADLESQCPDATPLEWLLRETPLTVLYSAIPNAAGEAARSKWRVVENVDDAAKPSSTKRRKGNADTLKEVGGTSKKKTMTHIDGWQHKFELLCAFQRENGHCRVPQRYIVASVRLGAWVKTQRRYYQNYKKGKVASINAEERLARLNSIGFVWSMKASMLESDTWQAKFKLLCAFQRENGHCRVPRSFIVHSLRLGAWVNGQRNRYQNFKKGKVAPVTEERIAQLHSIGFEWSMKNLMSDNVTWQHKFELLCGFQRENGHCRVPTSYIVDSVRLSIWVNLQRHYYQNSKKGKVAPITEERIAQLNSIGLEWRLKAPMSDSDTWQHKFELLCGFQRENGHCRVPQRYIVD
jgi:hypothetical protein